MALFFALSGFLITSKLGHGIPISVFLVRRLARILPLAYAYLGIAAVLLGIDLSYPAWTASFTVNYATEWLLGSYNSHFWSLCVEIHFYVGIAAAMFLGGRRALLIVWPACIAVSALRVIEGQVIAIQTHLRLDEILVGACVATCYGRIKPTGMTVTAFFVAVAGWLVCSHPLSGNLQYLRPYATGVVLWVALGLNSGWLHAFLVSRPMAYVAEISYGLYVLHPITVHGWMNEGSIMERYFVKRPISFALTFGLSHFSRFIWESYWVSIARRFGKPSRTQPSPRTHG